MRVRLRTLIEWGVCLSIAAGALETWLVAGLAIPWEVSGDSMAETLVGVHRNVVCADCGYPFSCGSESRPAAPRAVCPNCGYASNDLTILPDIGGERLLIDRAAFSFRPVRRWEIVALRWPQHADKILAKRIIGLPGETIEIRNGDIFIDGQLARKNLAEQRDLAILVHDAGYLPTIEPKLPRRWRFDRKKSNWHGAKGQFTFGAEEGPSETESVDWIEYHHGWRLADGTFVESPVTDICGYNQSQPIREEEVHPVADLMLSLRVAFHSGRGDFWVRLTDGGEAYEVRMEFEGKSPGILQYQTFCGGKPIQNVSGSVRIASGGETLVEASLVDQQFLLAFDGRSVATIPFDRAEPPKPSACPLALGARNVELTVRELRVYRDVYYSCPIGLPPNSECTQPRHLAADKCFVIGDNSPFSNDSRIWPDGGGVEVKLLVGKPFAAIPQLETSLWGGWYFQVPNPAEIRYIH
jgi:signal peptidase I